VIASRLVASLASLLFALTPTAVYSRPRSREIPARHIDPGRLPSGVALPYPTRRLFRGFGHCIGRGRHWHEAIDLGGIGPDGGIGTPVRSMVRARIVMIGSGDLRPDDFGVPYRGKRPVVRGGRKLPGMKKIPGYGEVHFFTARRGKWRSGTVIETVGLEAPLAGHRIRYMHLGAVRPDLAVGDVIEAGEELGLLGGTGVQTASPHVHIDIRTATDRAVDVAPLLGLPPTASCGPVRDDAEDNAEHFVQASPIGPPPPEMWPAGPEDDPSPPIDLDPPRPPWRVPSSPTAPPVDLAATQIDVPDCGLFEHLASGPADLRTHLHAQRWLELSLAPSAAGTPPDAQPPTPEIDLWDTTTSTRLLPGQKSPIAVTELPALAGQPARLRLVVATTTDLALVIRGAAPWRLMVSEKCKRAPAPSPAPAPAPSPTPAP